MSAQPKAIKSVVSLLGPAFVAAIAYVDPGNFATNLSAGSKYGYLLLWVLVAANLTASLVQYLSAKLGLVTGRSLPELVRDQLSEKMRIAYWLQAELAAMATDIAEVLGGAIALQLLFHLPLLLGGLIAGVVSLLLLLIQNNRSQRVFERVTLGLLLIVPIGFIAGLVDRPPKLSPLIHGLAPSFQGSSSVLLACGILGATVMPHVIYLHSALARDRHGKVGKVELKALLRVTRIDVGVAMLIAGGINIIMLLLAASSLRGVVGADTLIGAHQALRSVISPMVSTLFAIGLLASGLAATSVGCYAGSTIMWGLLRRRFPMLARRVLTLLPALIIIAAGANTTRALILSQVVLSFAIPFAIVPLVKISSSRQIMGNHANSRLTNYTAWAITGMIVVINILLIILLIL
jgi:manganese transport protein